MSPRTTPTRLVTILAMAAASAAGLGCGSDSGNPATDASTAHAATTAAGGPPPAELLGSYTTRLTKADTAGRKAPELKDHLWIMKITKDGGVDNAPTLTIIRAPSDVLESSTLSVAGTTLTLTGQECAHPSGDYTLVSSSYTWKLEGKTLRLATAKPGCPDKVAETILTSEVWMR